MQLIAHYCENKYLIFTSKNISLVSIFLKLFDTCIFQSIYVTSKKYKMIASMPQYVPIYYLIECFSFSK